VDLLVELRAIVGDAHVLAEPDTMAAFTTDWTGRFVGRADAVVRPADVEEVAAVVAACSRAGVPVVPQGGNTGLVGGATPQGGVVVSLVRLRGIGPVDDVSGQLDAGAGVTLAEVHEAVAGTPWRFPLDFGARDRATVGGMVATNAGGVHAMAHGTMRRRVVGVEAVLADGSVVRRLLGLTKDNTGYDLAGLLAGSEGTLGVVCSARLQLAPRPAFVVCALVGLSDLRAALAAAGAVARLGSTEAVELIAPECLDEAHGVGVAASAVHHAAGPSGGSGAAFGDGSRGPVLLVECAGAADPSDELAATLERCEGLVDVAVATDAARQRALWALRDGVPEAILRTGVPVKVDVAVPPGRLGEFLPHVVEAVASIAPDAKVWRFGHVADGNIHVNVTGIDATGPLAEEVEEAVLRLAVACDGTISAEHGVGRAKARWLGLSRSPEELAAFASIKGGLDPAGIMNPGVLGL
jgi:FAD/FMN-containing dehydrogenase